MGLREAIVCHQEGRLAQAERLYRDVLRASPRNFDALHMLGVLELQRGRAKEAASLIEAALKVDRTSAAALANHGVALAALGRPAQALASYDRALAIDPNNADVLSNRGDVLCDLDREDEALASYDRALAINSNLVSALVNRGVLYRKRGELAKALADDERALALDPADFEAWNNRGVVLGQLNRQEEALASYDRALALRPDYLDALFNRGNALLALKRPAEAIASYDRALELRPDFADAWNNRGNAHSALRSYDDALASYDNALAIKPDHLDARINRAAALAKLERYDEAIAAYQMLRPHAQEVPRLLNQLIGCTLASCRFSETEALRNELIEAALHGSAIVDPFTSLGLGSTPAQQLALTKRYLQHEKLAQPAPAWPRAKLSDERIRVAYLSADFHRHVTAYVMAELFELHDRGRFEIIGISFGPDDGSPVRRRLIRSFDRFFDVATRSDRQVAELIRDLDTNIAIDLKGHTTDSRIGILAHRTAPVQAAYMGFPATTGTDFIDYIIADPIVLPFDQQPFYTEKIVHLPDSYYTNDSKRAVVGEIPARAAAGLPERGFVFCCFNNNWKITGEMFALWMRLLKAVEGSVLWLLKSNASAVANLRQAAQAQGVDPNRLIFAPPVDLPEHLARVALADLFLDTLPYNAHTTASDALWMGVPVVTCTGTTFAGRVATSLLHAIGLPELVTTNLLDYEALALRLAREPELLRSIRDKLAHNRNRTALFDSDRFRRHIEAAYETMWDIWQRGEGPQSFSVAPIDPMSNGNKR